MPDQLPERLEAGTLPTPAIVALGEGIKFVRSIGTDEIKRRTTHLFILTLDRLSSIKSVKVYAPKHQGSTLLFTVNGVPSDQVSEHLDRNGICTRSGFHCCPLGHEALDTPKDGAVRVSFGIFNRDSDTDALYRAVRELVL